MITLEAGMSDESAADNPSSWHRWVSRNRARLLVGLVVLFVGAVRIQLRGMPMERDGGEYAYTGQLILHSVSAYKEACNMNLPGTYAACARITAFVGQSPNYAAAAALANAQVGLPVPMGSSFLLFKRKPSV